MPINVLASNFYRFTFPDAVNINNVLIQSSHTSGQVRLYKSNTTTILGSTNITSGNYNVVNTSTDVLSQWDLWWNGNGTVNSIMFYDQITVLQWRYPDEPTWNDLFVFPEIAGSAGVSGKTPEFRTQSGFFQWKYTDENSTAWRNAFPIPSNGTAGQDGDDGRTPVLVADGSVLKWRYSDEPPSANQTLLDVCGVCEGQDDPASTAVGVLQYLQELLTFSVMKRRNGVNQSELVNFLIALFGTKYPIAAAIASFVYSQIPGGVTPDEVTSNFPVPTRALMARGLAEFFVARGDTIFDLTIEHIATLGEVARLDNRLKWREFVTTFTPVQLQVAVDAYRGVPQPVFIQPRNDNQTWKASADKHLNFVVQTGDYDGNTSLGYSASYQSFTTDASTYTFKGVYNMNTPSRVNSVKVVLENNGGTTTFTLTLTYLSLGTGTVTHTVTRTVPSSTMATDVFFTHTAVENVKFVAMELSAGRFFSVFEIHPIDNDTPPSNPPWLECWQSDRVVMKHPTGTGTITFDVVLNNPPAGPTFNVDVLLHDGTGCTSGGNQQVRTDTRIYDGSLRYTMTFSLEGRTTITVWRSGLYEVDLDTVVWS
jgi:hypothetical protein